MRLRRGIGKVEVWERTNIESEDPEARAYIEGKSERLVFPLVFIRGGKAAPVDEQVRFRKGDRVHFVVFQEQRDAAVKLLGESGWSQVTEGDRP